VSPDDYTKSQRWIVRMVWIPMPVTVLLLVLKVLLSKEGCDACNLSFTR
jgi:hypothetical protein